MKELYELLVNDTLKIGPNKAHILLELTLKETVLAISKKDSITVDAIDTISVFENMSGYDKNVRVNLSTPFRAGTEVDCILRIYNKIYNFIGMGVYDLTLEDKPILTDNKADALYSMALNVLNMPRETYGIL